MAIGDMTPTVDDVAALCQARLKERGGGQAETFTDLTRPTATQVEKLCDKGAKAVASRVGIEPCNEALVGDATSAAALYAAMLVEQSYYPEQTRDAGSSFQSLLSLWKDDIKALTSQVAEECGGPGDEGGGAGAGLMPRAWMDDLPLIGRANPEQW